MKRTIQNIIIIFILTLGFIAWSGNANTAQAQTINCTGFIGSATGAFAGANVEYDASAGTCVVLNGVGGGGGSTVLDDMTYQMGVPGSFSFRSGTGGSNSGTDHNGCTILSNNIGAGVDCSAAYVFGASHADSFTRTDSQGRTVTMSVNYDAPGDFRLTINSATVTIVDPSAGSSGTGASTDAGNAAVAAATSQAQTKLTTNNIQRHVDVLTSGGVRGNAPSGPQGTVPTSDERNEFSALTRASVFTKNQPFERHGFSSDTRYNDNKSGANDLRSALIAMTPHFGFDTARGDGSIFSGERLNQVEDTLSSPDVGTQTISNLGSRNVNLWAYSSYSNIKNSQNNTGGDQRFDGDVWTITGGGDYRLSAGKLVGLALSYSTVNLDTDFNDGDYDEDAYTISPYAVWQLNNWLTVNGALGYTYSNIDQETAQTTTLATSDTDANTYFATINAKATHNIDAWTLASSLGYTLSSRDVDSFTDSLGAVTNDASSNSSELRIGAEAGYNYVRGNDVFFPFVKGDYLIETNEAINNDPVAIDLGGGFRWFNDTSGLSGSLEGTVQTGRDDYDQWTVQGILAKSYNSDALVGSLTPGFNVGLADGRQAAGFKMDYTHASDAFSFGLDANMYRSASLFDDENEDRDTDQEGVVKLIGKLKF